MLKNIMAIVGNKADGTATPLDVLFGKTFMSESSSKVQLGTSLGNYAELPSGSVTTNRVLTAIGSYVIPKGRYFVMLYGGGGSGDDPGYSAGGGGGYLTPVTIEGEIVIDIIMLGNVAGAGKTSCLINGKSYEALNGNRAFRGRGGNGGSGGGGGGRYGQFAGGSGQFGNNGGAGTSDPNNYPGSGGGGLATSSGMGGKGGSVYIDASNRGFGGGGGGGYGANGGNVGSWSDAGGGGAGFEGGYAFGAGGSSAVGQGVVVIFNIANVELNYHEYINVRYL